MKKLRITQIKSKIGRPERQKRTLAALGLKKMHQTREITLNDQTKGMVEKVKHLLKIEEI
ncbi:MAG: 50S ribosomal protein L30 [Bacteroidales bacterium]